MESRALAPIPPPWPIYGYNSVGTPCQRSSRLTRGLIAASATTALGLFWIRRQPVASIGDSWKRYAGLATLAVLLTFVAIDFPKCD